MNKNGERTVDAVVRLRDEYEPVASEGPLVKFGADPEEWQQTMDGIGELLRQGEEYRQFWVRCVHGETLPDTGESLEIKKEWTAWLRQTKGVGEMLAESRRETEGLRAIGDRLGSEEVSGFGLLLAADRFVDQDNWWWSAPATDVVVEFATAFSGGTTGGYDLILDSLALGYFVYEEERDRADEPLSFSPQDRENLENVAAESGESEALKVGAWTTGEQMPKPFSLSAEDWESICVDGAALRDEPTAGISRPGPPRHKGEEVALEEGPSPASISEGQRTAFGFGYGLGMAGSAIGVPVIAWGKQAGEDYQPTLAELERKYGTSDD